MPEAVIVATARTPDRSGVQGLARQRTRRRHGRVHRRRRAEEGPELDRQEVDDLMLGCGLPGGEQGFNMGASSRSSPGCARSPAARSPATARRRCRRCAWPRTRSRPARATCSSPPGVEAVSRFMVGGSSDHTPNTQNHEVRRRRRPQRSVARAAGDQGDVDAGRGSARRLHRDGRDRGERRRDRGRLARGDGRLRVPVAAARRRRDRPRVLRAGDHAVHVGERHRRHRRTTARVPTPSSRSSRR